MFYSQRWTPKGQKIEGDSALYEAYLAGTLLESTNACHAKFQTSLGVVRTYSDSGALCLNLEVV